MAIRPNTGTAFEKRVKIASHANNKTFDVVNDPAIANALALARTFASSTAWAEWNVEGGCDLDFEEKDEANPNDMDGLIVGVSVGGKKSVSDRTLQRQTFEGAPHICGFAFLACSCEPAERGHPQSCVGRYFSLGKIQGDPLRICPIYFCL